MTEIKYCSSFSCFYYAFISAADIKEDQSILIGFYTGDLAENPTLDKVRLFSLDVFPQLITAGALKRLSRKR
jgi:hypothetical protein